MKEKIKDLYIKAGVEAIPCFNCGMDSDCSRCKFQDNLEFPPFTTEKQIAILQFLLEKFHDFGALKWSFNGKYKLYIRHSWGEFEYEGEFSDTFEEAIATALTDLWDKLGKVEKKKLTKILAAIDKEDMRWVI